MSAPRFAAGARLWGHDDVPEVPQADLATMLDDAQAAGFTGVELGEAAAREAGLAFAQRLLEANGNRVLDDFDDRITESRRSVEGALRRTLEEIVTTAEGAAERASEIRSRGAAAVEDALRTIDARLAKLEALRSAP